MNRRRILKATLAAGALGATAFSAPAIAQRAKEWKIALSWPENTPGLGESAQRFAKTVETATDGRLRIRVYGAGQLVPALQVFDAVQAGSVEMYHSTEHYYVGKHPALAFFSTIPFGLTAMEHYGWIYQSDGQKLWDELSGKFGIKPFICGTTGPQMGGWFNKEINSLQDIRGLKIRQPGMGGEVWRQLGAAVTMIPPAEIFSAMQAGVIDAVDWTGPWTDLQQGLHTVAKYYYFPSMAEPSAPITIGINADAWKTLSASEQLIVSSAIQSEALNNAAEWQTNNGESLQKLLVDHKVQTKEFPKEVIAEMARVLPALLHKVRDHDALGRRVYESWSEFLRKQIAWSRISSDVYLRNRTEFFK